jgi:hypothetical protein
MGLWECKQSERGEWGWTCSTQHVRTDGTTPTKYWIFELLEVQAHVLTR